jgi:hypothetical protein
MDLESELITQQTATETEIMTAGPIGIIVNTNICSNLLTLNISNTR